MLTEWSQIEDGVRGRIAFLVRGLDGGGAQRDAILLANELQRLGRPSAVVALEAAGHLRDLVATEVSLIDLGSGNKLRLAAAIGPLRRLLIRGRPAVLVSSEAGANAVVVLASRLVPLRQRPKIVLREVASPAAARLRDPYWQNRLGYRLAPFAYPAADRVLTFTEGARHDLIAGFGVPADKVVSLGANAVLTPAMRQGLAELGRAPEPGLIVSVGRLSPEKGFADLIEAFALLRASRPARLEILGEGSGRPRLEALIADKGLQGEVELPGHFADPLPRLARASLFVSASSHEGLGNALIEAMAAGVPVVATDAPHGPREILLGGQLGPLVPVGDVGALARAMADVLEAPTDSTRLQDRAADFTVEVAAERFLAVLEAELTQVVTAGEVNGLVGPIPSEAGGGLS